MRIKYTVSMAGLGNSFSPGDVAEVDDAEGGRLIAAGFAAAVEEPAAAADPGDGKPSPKAKAKAKSGA